MKINILLPYKEKFTKNEASSVSITVSNNLEYSKYQSSVSIFGQFVEKPMFKKNFNGIKKPLNFFKKKNLHIALEMCKKINNENDENTIIEIHNRPYLINKIKSKLKKSHILTHFFHNDPLQMKGSKSITERKNLLLNLDKIYCVSEYIKRRFLTGISKNHAKVVVLYNGVKRKHRVFPKKKKLVIFVGRIVEEKGVHLFANAIKEIYNLFEKWEFKIIGSPRLGINTFDNYSKKIKNDFERLGKRAKMSGFIDSTNLNQIVSKSSIIVIPSTWQEPFGLVAAEAMSHGTAIIASNVGGLPEIIKKHGILINKINAEKISNKLKELMNNESLLKSYQKKSWHNFILNSKRVSFILDKHRKELFFKN